MDGAWARSRLGIEGGAARTYQKELHCQFNPTVSRPGCKGKTSNNIRQDLE